MDLITINMVLVVFGLCKTTFNFIGWYSQGDHDKYYRGQLEDVLRRLRENSPGKILRIILIKVQFSINALFVNKFKLLVLLTIYYSIAMILFAFCVIGWHHIEMDRYAMMPIIKLLTTRKIFFINLIVSSNIVAIGSCAYLLMLIFIVKYSLKYISTKLKTLIVLSVMAVIIIVSNFYWVVILEGLAMDFSRWNIGPGAEYSYDFLFTNPQDDIFINSMRAFLIIAILLNYASWITVPYVAFTLSILIVLIASRLNSTLRKFGLRCIYLITSDSQPVFKQLGSAIGIIAAITTYLARLIIQN